MRCSSRTLRRISSGPSTITDGTPGYDGRSGTPDAGHQPVVAVAAGLADHRQADLHPRAVDQPVGERLLDAEVGAARVAHRGDRRPAASPEVPRRLVELVGERRVRLPPQVDVAGGDVHVAVEQARAAASCRRRRRRRRRRGPLPTSTIRPSSTATSAGPGSATPCRRTRNRPGTPFASSSAPVCCRSVAGAVGRAAAPVERPAREVRAIVVGQPPGPAGAASPSPGLVRARSSP